MDTIKNGPNCAASIAPHDFVCDYCGHVIFERVKNTDSLKSGIESFDQGMEIIKENLNALHDIPKPSLQTALKSSLRLFVAFLTLGIVLIFWRRPKKRFVKENYDKLKSIISRNISFLKISSAGSTDLTSRINVLENELKQIDNSVKKGLLQRNIAYAVVIVLYGAWLIYVANKEPVKHSTYSVIAYDTIAQGNALKHFIISRDTVKIKHTPTGSYDEWEMNVKITTSKMDELSNKKVLINCELVLTDKYGMEIKGFQHGVPDDLSKQKMRSALSTQNNKTDYYKFLIKNDLNYSQYRDTIPEDITHFILITDTLTKK